MSRIITNEQLDMVSDAEPTEVLFAIHKRIVSAEKAFLNVRDIVNDLSIELEMIKERLDKLEQKESK